MSRTPKNSRNTHRIDLCAAARLGPIMGRRAEQGKTVVAPTAAKAILWSLVNYGGVDGRAWPSRKTLADEAETSVATVRRVIDILRDEGLISAVVDRTRGGKAGRKGEGHDGATNVYILDYDVLAQWGDDGDGGAEDGAQDEPRSWRRKSRVVNEERGSVEVVTRLSDEGNAALLAVRSKEVEPYEPYEPSPPPPAGVPDGGGVAVDAPQIADGARNDRAADASTLREQAAEILAAYPRTANDLPLADEQAAIDAILGETGRSERCGWAEIRDAAATVRDLRPKDPVWPRNWLRLRGYLPLVLDARRRASAPPPAPVEHVADRSDRERADVDAGIAATEAALCGMTADELRAEHAALLAATVSAFARKYLETLDPTSDRMLRGLIAARLAKKGLVTA